MFNLAEILTLLIGCLLALNNNCIPPTINLDKLDPELDNKVNYTANKAQSHSIKYALCNTFGFGGHNASIIFKKI